MTSTPRVMTILWPSFAMAGVLEGVVFSVVDPADLRWFGHAPIGASPQAVYTLSFLLFWALISASGALTALLGFDADGTQAPAGRAD